VHLVGLYTYSYYIFTSALHVAVSILF
jgi:hypothetical protein